MLISNVPIQVDIVSAEASIFSGQALMVTVMGSLGEMAITHGHSPLLASLKPGQVRIKVDKNTEEAIYVSGGLLEVQPNTITILADTAVRAADLDEAAALAAKERAEGMLEQRKMDFDYSLAAKELAQAVAQLKAIRDLKKKAKLK
jgi:F-type H+-transporting ATPase subunit epsilon